MTRTTLAALGAAFSLFAGSAVAAPAPVFTPEQEARIGQIAADYMLAHPEILVQVSQKLQAQQQERQQKMYALSVMENQEALLRDADTPAYGPENAKVAVIEFFDYQCIWCSKLAPEIEKAMKANPDVRFLFKEWPIFAGKWAESEQAAQRGLAVWKAKGAEAYVTYHNSIYHTGHAEGELTAADIDAAAKAAGFTDNTTPDNTAVLERNDALAQQLGLTGTPGLIIMPVTGAKPGNITVLSGGTTAAQIQAAIKKAAQ
ncbi:DsbA family protein [Cronobacter sakazakii]|uniref:DsbA family protein n=1 Tax=Cronobacter sakazakii TaxID=28141 RepID=UPI00131250A2|nr:DsbA family protein [Cronobacter sakazakii]ELY2676445.1 thioredoxin domain-containing protein [Cronobacter sakazakii]ELY2751429.1 thioredoxin domain-containing protein [Cronobacter sakazakii]ELY4327795.1 thioredoxin domain-containing protein [Cronobacter sakazakii]ELY4740697.1 thioredoxin domain-containing protein [Cronobacter sakazakii]ELY5800492.1 thioredoxin domain-containing protein [Cronobacter sakazakii]